MAYGRPIKTARTACLRGNCGKDVSEPSRNAMKPFDST
jgi:hypothetical protein